MPSIRHQLFIAATPRAIWTLLTTAEGLTRWYADEARIDGRKGGRVVITTEDDEGEPVEEVGTILTWRPTSRFEIRWDSSSPAVTKGTTLSFSLARSGDETQLALLHSGGGVLDDEEQRPGLDKAWRQALKALRDELEG